MRRFLIGEIERGNVQLCKKLNKEVVINDFIFNHVAVANAIIKHRITTAVVSGIWLYGKRDGGTVKIKVGRTSKANKELVNEFFGR